MGRSESQVARQLTRVSSLLFVQQTPTRYSQVQASLSSCKRALYTRSPTATMPSIRSQASRSISPSPPRENTALLAPATPTPAHGFQNQAHLRKASVGGRSVSGRSTAGSIRGYGTVGSRPGPASQAPRVSKLGQRVCLF